MALCLSTGPVLNPTGDVAVCKGSVAVLNCIYTDGTFPHFTLNNTDVSQYNVTVTESGTFLHLEVPGAPWSNNAIIRCDVSGIASEPAVLHVQGTDQNGLEVRNVLHPVQPIRSSSIGSKIHTHQLSLQ